MGKEHEHMKKKVEVIQDNMEKELEQLIQVASTNTFPWYYQIESTSPKFSFFSHIVVPRYNHEQENTPINSNLFEFVETVLKDFCERNKIKYTKMLRCSFNLMTSFKSYEHTDPHIDYPFPHKVCIMYLNDTVGDTVVFEETYEEDKNVILLESLQTPLTIGESITPKKGLVVCFDGDHYHANRFCNENDRRVIIVMCFI